ncbi:hypothetical protein DAEQUDRAFT_58553 [Daedalea quercina L-15889]|uniref:Uncharacterized protein n=1 Tax=Daedalea quercina L-15889 TaxID=1314783 RepID=A0A165SKN8_9APHY|nr:hypothetical protein DAEQUDRAFT_58553 [Daedalea quercina L-15889]
MPSTLANILQIGLDGPCLTTDFARAVHNASDSIRASPVFAMESFQFTDPNDPLSKHTSGKIVHQFIMVTVHVRDVAGEWAWTYFRVDFDNNPPPHGRQNVALSDDHEDLRGYWSRGLARIAGVDQPGENGPSLDDIASLLEIMHRRTPGGYDALSRDCLWLTENLLLSTARKYSQHWLAGHCKPEPLRRYTEGNSDVVACIMQLVFHDPISQTVAGTAVRAVRGMQAFFTQAAPNRIEPHDEEIRLILEEWQPCVKAGFM